MSIAGILLVLFGLTVPIYGASLSYIQTINLQLLYPGCYELNPYTFAESPKGDQVIGVSCGTSGQSYLISNGTKLNYTLGQGASYSAYETAMWATNGSLLTCGSGYDEFSEDGYLFKMQSISWENTLTWSSTPHKNIFPKDISEPSECYLIDDTILYTSYSSPQSTVGVINTTTGILIKDVIVNLPNYHKIDSVLPKQGGGYVIVGKGWEKDPEIFYGIQAKLFYASYNIETNTVENIKYYSLAPSASVTDYNNPSDVYLFALGDYYVFVHSVSANGDFYNVMRKISPDGTTESIKVLKTIGYSLDNIMKFGPYIAMRYWKSNTEDILILVDEDLSTVREYSLPTNNGEYIVIDFFKHPTKDSVVIALGKAREVRVYHADYLADCADGYTADENYDCAPCHSSCLTCSSPNDSQTCTSCIYGLTAFDTNAPVFNCTFYGPDDTTMQCIDEYVQETVPLIELSSWVRSFDAGFYFNFKKSVFECSGMEFNSSLVSDTLSVDITEDLGIKNSTTLSVTLPLALINDSTCDTTTVNGIKSRTCVIYIYMVGALTKERAAGFKINFRLDYNVNSTVVTTSVIIGSYTLYEEHTEANGTTLVAAESKVCQDETCAVFANKKTYTQGEYIYIIHSPTVGSANLVAVSDINVTFTKDGSVKNAMDYLVSQQNNSDGTLITKIELLDSSSKPIIISFSLVAKLKLTRRLLETRPNNGYSKTSFTFMVLPKEEPCPDSVFGCYQEEWITGIACGSALLLLIVGIVVYFRCKKVPIRQEVPSQTESSRAVEKQSEMTEEKEVSVKMP